LPQNKNIKTVYEIEKIETLEKYFTTSTMSAKNDSKHKSRPKKMDESVIFEKKLDF